MASATASATTARVILEELERRGLDPAPLLRNAGIDRGVLFNPVGRLPRDAILTFCRLANAASGDPVLHAAATANTEPGAFAIADYMTALAPTIGEGYERILRQFHIVNPWLRFEVVPQASDFLVVAHPVHVLKSDPIELECTLLALAVRTKQITELGQVPLDVAFDYKPGYAADLAPWFPCPVVFGAQHNGIRFDASTWAAKSTFANRELAEILVYLARPLVRETRFGTELQHVEQAVAQAILAGRSDALTIARLLGKSVRTLQRLLSNLGTSLSGKVDEVRHRLAVDALRAGQQSVTQIAMMLGFSEASAFSRAFRRWTGRSPRSFRGGNGET